MSREAASARVCLKCGSKLESTGRLAERAHAEGMCWACWLDEGDTIAEDNDPVDPREAAVCVCGHSRDAHQAKVCFLCACTKYEAKA